MQPLFLSPLPTLRTESESTQLQMEREGFVDEMVIKTMLAPTAISRSMARPSDLALAADDMDFAGWSMSPFATAARSETPQPRRARPPVILEPGLEAPHQGSHRWWLAGIAGAFSTILFSALLLNLSTRGASHFDAVLSPGMFVTAKPTVLIKEVPAKATPQLTDASPLRR